MKSTPGKFVTVLTFGGGGQPSGYELEAAIEVNFSAVLDATDDEVALDKMRVLGDGQTVVAGDAIQGGDAVG